MSTGRKVLWTVFALGVVAAALSGRVDNLGRYYAQETLTRALVTFAVARTLNGVISTAQGTELSLEPGGVGVNFSIGEVLDPINDLIERFSTVMLVATTSLGLQNVLLSMTAWWGISVLLSAAAALTIAALWAPRAAFFPAAAARRWLLIISIVRFAVPALMITSSIVFDMFLAEEHAAATVALESTGEEIEDFNAETPSPTADDPSIIDQLGTLIGDSLRGLNARERLEQLHAQVSDAAEHIIDLIVIFVFQTIVLPLAFLWFLAELAKSVIARTAKL